VSLWERSHVLKLPQLCIQKTLVHLTGGSWLLQIRHVPLAVLLSALNHHKLDLIDLLRVMIRESLDHLAFLQIPNN
jgi:hypothetical protein